MSNKSASSTPTRSSTREQKKATQFRVATPTSAKGDARFKKILSHSISDSHYVDYEVELTNGRKIKATEFDFEKSSKMLAAYKTEVTGQQDDNTGECVVEKIVTHRMVHKKPLFLVQWNGYPNPIWNSELWETELENCETILSDYKKENQSSFSAETPTRAQNTPAPKRSSNAQSNKRTAQSEGEPSSKARKVEVGGAIERRERKKTTTSQSPTVKSQEVQSSQEVQESDGEDDESPAPTGPSEDSEDPTTTNGRGNPSSCGIM